jgi:Replication stress response SDE2 C-terminal/Silencing defective 2 N-terminal ubiquitin domain/SPRY domain
MMVCTSVVVAAAAVSAAIDNDDDDDDDDGDDSRNGRRVSRMNQNQENHPHQHPNPRPDILIRFQNQTILYTVDDDVDAHDDDDDSYNGNSTTISSFSSSSSSSSSFSMMTMNDHCNRNKTDKEKDATKQEEASSLLLLKHVGRVTGWKTRFLEIVRPSSSTTTTLSSSKQQQQDEPAPLPFLLLFVRVRVKSCIRGGKGGFGALLKSQSRKSGEKSTTNFGACRDLQGRRLRHVNDQMALQHWQEWRQKINAGEADQVDMVQATQLETISGLPGWHLQLPAWSDVSKKERRKWQVQFRQWKRHVEAQDAAKRRERERKESQIQHYVDAANDAVASVQSNLTSALQEGLLQQQQQQQLLPTKRQKQHHQPVAPPLAIVALSGDVDIVESSGKTNSRSSGSAASGTGVVWQIQSQSNFCTIGIALQIPTATTPDPQQQELFDENDSASKNDNTTSSSSKKDVNSVHTLPSSLHKDMILYYEVRLVTGGLAQVGWAMAPTTTTITSSATAATAAASAGYFSPNSATGDGVGDDAYSYAYDGSRGICLHQSTSQPYGRRVGDDKSSSYWQKDDIVGCMYYMKTGEISYFLNGEALGVAFTVTTTTTTTTSTTTDGPLAAAQHTPVILFPAASCNPGEVIELHLYAEEMQHIPKPSNDTLNGPKQQTLTMIGNVMATQDINFGLLLDDADDCDDNDDDEEDDHADDEKKSPNTGDGTGAGAVAVAKEEQMVKDSNDVDDHDKKPAATVADAAEEVLVVEPLNLDAFASPEELESLGLNRLKGALMAIRVKCGGTLAERANRLFSLKGMAAEDYPKNLLAKRKG